MVARTTTTLVALALLASGAMVGMTMASGTWMPLGEGLAPGEGYALRLREGADRFRLTLDNASGDARASFSVYAPDGQRAGHYTLDAGTRSVEVVGPPGLWMVFVYQAQGGDLALAAHGANGSALLQRAEVERREVVLGHFAVQQSLDATYTAMIDEEPVLAGVYVHGSARGFRSELRTERGVVETVHEEQVDAAAAGVYVEQRGQRSAQPQNLAEGPYTARVTAERLSGELVLVTLHLRAPPEPEAPQEPAAPEPRSASPQGQGEAPPPAEPPGQAPSPGDPSTGPQGAPAPASPASGTPRDAARCGIAPAGTAVGLATSTRATLHLTLEGSGAGWVSVFGPRDDLLAAVQLHGGAPTAALAVEGAGEHVLYVRGAAVQAALQGARACTLRALAMTKELVAVVRGSAEATVNATAQAAFTLARAPVEFEFQVVGASTSVLGVHAVFQGPLGPAAHVGQAAVLGLTGGSGSTAGTRDAAASVEAAKMVAGAWLLEFRALMQRGDVEAYALHYSRAAAEAAFGAAGGTA